LAALSEEPRARRRVFLIALTTLAVVLVAIELGRHQARLQARAVAANTAKAETLKGAIDRRFLPGALESHVVEALKSEYPGHVTWPASNWTEYGLPVGDEPSDVWYCGSWTRGVKLRFESGRLVSTVVERWSNDCM
jgi:hypothetical protein